jgi:hypothetical protein
MDAPLDYAWFASAYTYLYLSPKGDHLYYSGYQLNAADLKRIEGKPGEDVLAENSAGTFAIGNTKVFDSQLMRAIGTLPTKTSPFKVQPTWEHQLHITLCRISLNTAC